jgi:crotonobetainyl-CoA:carnitine CoA-transferase CaiB-like acyl-CoA transferase
MPANGPKHVLDGYKALDFTQFVAGPTVTKLMAEMGAEVIKVEIAPDGDRSRGMPFVKNQRSGYFVQQNRGKLSVCMDPRTEAGKAIIAGLIAKVDVVVENFAPGVIKRMGFDYPKVRKLNPKIIMCSVSTFGQEGPLSNDPGYDFMGQAYAGVTSHSGEEGGAHFPTLISMGVSGCSAIACALLHRKLTGEGQYLDISLVDAYFYYHDIWVQSLSASGGAAKPIRTGLHYAILAPAGMFKGPDGYIFVFAWLDHHWVKLCALMGRPELGKDPRFIDNPSRVKNRAEVITIVEGWLQSLPSTEAAVELLRAARLPQAPVLSVEQAMKHPHLVERQTVQTVHDRLLGDFQIPGFPLRFSSFPGRLDLEAPFLGEHNGQVLASYLGYTPEHIGRLERDGVLHNLPR